MLMMRKTPACSCSPNVLALVLSAVHTYSTICSAVQVRNLCILLWGFFLPPSASQTHQCEPLSVLWLRAHPSVPTTAALALSPLTCHYSNLLMVTLLPVRPAPACPEVCICSAHHAIPFLNLYTASQDHGEVVQIS